MKRITILLLTAFFSFGFQQLKAQDMDSIPVNQVHFDKTLMDSVLYGNCDFEFIRSNSIFGEFFEFFYNDYMVNPEPIIPYVDKLMELEITIIMGSWCSDSQEQVPKFMRILEELGYPPHTIKIICVDGDKNVEGMDIKALEINLVPTFIFTLGEKEVGRIVETPEETLESDIAMILMNLD